MASKVSGIIEQIQTGGSSGTTYAIASTAYGYCTTEADKAIKNVDMTGFYLQEGVTIHVKFQYANSANNPKLKFNGEANDKAKPIVQYGTTAAGTTSETNGWYAGAVLTLTYDGTSWVRDQGFNTNSVSSHTHKTNELSRPSYLVPSITDPTVQPLINDLRANHLAFLPADQIIIEKTIDGGNTWTDAGVADSVKTGLFSETRPSVDLPRINNARSTLCGIRITFSPMKYNVPAGTPETEKYNYWNSSYVKSQERYNNLSDMYFWVGSNGDRLSVKLEYAKGNASTTWSIGYQDADALLNGWSGGDYIKLNGTITCGGSTTQTNQPWNFRLTFMSAMNPGATSFAQTSVQRIYEIRGYGNCWWTRGNYYASSDHLYSWDYNKNATFPANLTATKFIGPLQGNADTATKFNSTRTIELTGAVTGSATTDGSSGWTIATTVNHGHGNITNDGKSTSNSITGSNVEVTTGHKFLREDGTWVVPAYTTNTNTHRPIKVNGTQILGDNITALNLKAGNNITITATANQSDVTIAATDTTYSTFVKSGSSAASGLVPAPSTTAGTTKFLREDASWQTAVTSITITAGAGITVNSSDAITTTGTRTISITGIDTTSGDTDKWLNKKGEWTTPPDTNNAVTQTANTENKEFSILLKNSDNTITPATETAGVKFANTTNKLVTVNPSTGNISAYSFNKLTLTEATTGFTISGGNTTSRTLTVTNNYTLGAACAKSVDTDTMTSSSTNLPTAKAVAAYITSQGFLTSQNTAVLYATSENGTGHSTSLLSNPYLRLIDGTSGSNVQLQGDGMTTVKAVNGVITINTPQVTASTLGLEAALRFKGTTSTNITLAANKNNSNITIDGTPYTAIIGDVVLYDDGEYLWTDGGWEELGHASAFKKIQTAITDDEGDAAVNAQQQELEGEKFIYSFSQDAEGVVSVLTRKIPTHPTGNGNQHLPEATGDETGYYLRCADASTGAGEWHALTLEDLGATSVTLNDVDCSGDTATFYAPLSYGAAGSPLIGAGENEEPIWYDGLTLSGASASDYSATFAGTTNSTSKDTGSVLISGGLGVSYNVSAAKYIVDDHVTLQWNSTDQSLDFIFA